MQQQYSEELCETQISNKWRGSVRMAMKSPVERVWKLGADFLGLKKWLPYIDICRHVEGKENAVGCVRYCSGGEISSTDNQKTWVKEKLLSMDDRYYSYTYSVIDGNLGMDGYVASFQLCHEGDGNGVVEWSFEANPSEHCTEQQFVDVMNSYLGKMIQRLDEAAATLA